MDGPFVVSFAAPQSQRGSYCSAPCPAAQLAIAFAVCRRWPRPRRTGRASPASARLDQQVPGFLVCREQSHRALQAPRRPAAGRRREPCRVPKDPVSACRRAGRGRCACSTPRPRLRARPASDGGVAERVPDVDETRRGRPAPRAAAAPSRASASSSATSAVWSKWMRACGRRTIRASASPASLAGGSARSAAASAISTAVCPWPRPS